MKYYNREELRDLLNLCNSNSYTWIDRIGNYVSGYAYPVASEIDIIDYVNTIRNPTIRERHIKTLIEKKVITNPEDYKDIIGEDTIFSETVKEEISKEESVNELDSVTDNVIHFGNYKENNRDDIDRLYRKEEIKQSIPKSIKIGLGIGAGIIITALLKKKRKK